MRCPRCGRRKHEKRGVCQTRRRQHGSTVDLPASTVTEGMEHVGAADSLIANLMCATMHVPESTESTAKQRMERFLDTLPVGAADNLFANLLRTMSESMDKAVAENRHPSIHEVSSAGQRMMSPSEKQAFMTGLDFGELGQVLQSLLMDSRQAKMEKIRRMIIQYDNRVRTAKRQAERSDPLQTVHS